MITNTKIKKLLTTILKNQKYFKKIIKRHLIFRQQKENTKKVKKFIK